MERLLSELAFQNAHFMPCDFKPLKSEGWGGTKGIPQAKLSGTGDTIGDYNRINPGFCGVLACRFLATAG
jgi:hypothetical protein